MLGLEMAFWSSVACTVIVFLGFNTYWDGTELLHLRWGIGEMSIENKRHRYSSQKM